MWVWIEFPKEGRLREQILMFCKGPVFRAIKRARFESSLPQNSPKAATPCTFPGTAQQKPQQVGKHCAPNPGAVLGIAAFFMDPSPKLLKCPTKLPGACPPAWCYLQPLRSSWHRALLGRRLAQGWHTFAGLWHEAGMEEIKTLSTADGCKTSRAGPFWWGCSFQ